jgi:hypothetical protein
VYTLFNEKGRGKVQFAQGEAQLSLLIGESFTSHQFWGVYNIRK